MDPDEPEACRVEERPVLGLRAFLTTSGDQVEDVGHFDSRRGIPGGNDHLDDQEAPVFGETLTAIPEHAEGAVVVQPVDDALEKIHVPATGKGRPVVSRDELTARRDAGRVQDFPSVLDEGG